MVPDAEISNTVLLLIALVIIYIILIFVNKRRRTKRLCEKKSNHYLIIPFKRDKDVFGKIVYNIVKDFWYNMIRTENVNNQIIISDNIGVFTWGFYYLLEYNNNEIKIYLMPRYFLEFINRFGKFDNRLEKLAALIQLAENNYSNE